MAVATAARRATSAVASRPRACSCSADFTSSCDALLDTFGANSEEDLRTASDPCCRFDPDPGAPQRSSLLTLAEVFKASALAEPGVKD
mmetsp:Transcript_21177/g.46111  ORF Transcript_21177/g.46111 Transcript_21177/m.46111 type:complete len:88 (-) Transcript_21177:394-657(-)|eukprot:6189019-Pleurochrysis_carterae.AAC.2